MITGIIGATGYAGAELVRLLALTAFLFNSRWIFL
jgi:N-acetyl-gamma-glutamylphosphate reductase